MEELSPQEAARRRQLGLDWMKIHAACLRNAELRALYLEFLRVHGPTPSHHESELVRREMLSAIAEMEVYAS